MQGTIVAVCMADARGQKTPAASARLVRGHGIEGDVHAGDWHRQVSLLEEEKIDEMRARGLELGHGAFGENLVTQGVSLAELAVGRRLRVGAHGVLQVTQRGKECHTRCPIFSQAGDCIMPSHGVFARVLHGGDIGPGDRIQTDAALDVVRFAVVTLSDRGSAGQNADTAGPLVQELVKGALGLGAHLVSTCVLPDDRSEIETTLVRLCDEEICDLIITTGGTGLGPRDVTPDATLAVIDRPIPGMAEAMRAEGLCHTPHAMLSRAVCGQRGTSLILNLSGSPRAVREQLAVLLPALPHALTVASGVPQSCAR